MIQITLGIYESHLISFELIYKMGVQITFIHSQNKVVPQTSQGTMKTEVESHAQTSEANTSSIPRTPDDARIL